MLKTKPTEITIQNDDREQLRVREVRDNSELIEIVIEDSSFWMEKGDVPAFAQLLSNIAEVGG